MALASGVRVGRLRYISRCERRILVVSPLGGELLVHSAAPRFERRGKMLAKFFEKLVVRLELIAPGRRVDASQLSILRGRELLEPLPVEVFEAGHRAQRRVLAMRTSLAALDHPLQHAHVFA